ncbi:MAG: tetratricopeptide repeat protein [Actinomycetota bacterium]|nr:tetratricopeptide repeat protein [Actinomycetota bacterium]
MWTVNRFVDRQDALDAFDRFVTAPDRLLFFSGMSGLGKSTLLAELVRRHGPRRARVIDLESLAETVPGGHTDLAFAVTDAVAEACVSWTGGRTRRYRLARDKAVTALADAYRQVPDVKVTATGGSTIRDVSINVVTDPAAVRAAGLRAQHRQLLARALADDLRGHDLDGRVLLFDSVERLPYLDEIAGPQEEPGGTRQTSWFLTSLVPRLLDAGLRVVLAGREPPPPGLGAVHVPLAEWAAEHTAEMLESRGVEDRELAAALHRTCGGLPGWVDLAAAAVAEARGSGPGLTASEVARRAAAHPVHRWLPEVFLDRLPPARHAVVTAAAVPRVLGRATLRALLDDGGVEEDTLDRYSFVRTEIGPDGEPARTLHPLVRTALLESLRRNDPGLLRRLHERARDHFAAVGPEAEHRYHALALADPAAVQAWRRQVDEAITSADFAAARTALDLVLVPEQRPVLLAGHALAVIEGELAASVVGRATHRFDEAVAHLDEADRLAGRYRNREAHAAVARERARLALRRNGIADGLDEARIALQLAEDFGLGGEAGDAHDLLGDLSVRAGDLSAAQQHFERAIEAYGKSGVKVGEANALLSLGTLTIRTGDRDRARQLLERALKTYVEEGRRGGQADAHQALGEVALQRHDHDAARRHLMTAERLNVALDDQLGVANCRYRLAELAVAEPGADERFHQVEQDYRRLDDALGVANAHRGRGTAALHRRDFPAAEEHLTRAELEYADLGSAYGQAMCRYLRARLLIERNQPIEAARMLVLALSAFGESDDRSARARAESLLGVLQIESGAVREGEVLLRSARGELAATGRAEDVAAIDEALAKVDADRSGFGRRLETLTPAARLLLDLLALLHPADTFPYVVTGVWPVAWQQTFPGQPPPGLDATQAALTSGGLIAVVDGQYTFPEPALRPMVRDAVPAERRTMINELLMVAWIQVFEAGRHAPDSTTVRAGAGAAVYAIERGEFDDAWAVLAEAQPIASALGLDGEILELMRECAMRSGDSSRYASYFVTRAGGPDEALEVIEDLDEAGDDLLAEIHHQFLERHQPAAALALAERIPGGRGKALRLNALYALGRHAEVLSGLEEAVASAAGDRERVSVLHDGVGSAKATRQWELSLVLNERIRQLLLAQGASRHELMHYAFSDNAALMELGRFDECSRLLASCEAVFRGAGDEAQLRQVTAARALLATRQGDVTGGLPLDRAALREAYAARDATAAANLHVNYANHLRLAGLDPAERVAHRLAAVILYELTGNESQASRALIQAHAEPRRHGLRSTMPKRFTELATVVARIPGLDLRALLNSLHSPDAISRAEALIEAARR